jgi:O-antigen ligase
MMRGSPPVVGTVNFGAAVPAGRRGRRSRPAPPVLVTTHYRASLPAGLEYSYYAIFFYSAMAVAWGLSVNMLVSGMLATLAVVCVTFCRSRLMRVYAPIVPLLSFATSYIAVQVFVHGEPFMGDTVRPFVPWMLMVIVTQTLSLRRGFSLRFAFVILLFLLTTLRHLGFVSDGGVLRANLDSTLFSIANPNDLAAWFGFCAVYFITFAIEMRRPVLAAVSWPIVVVCLYAIALSVSRGALISVAIASTVPFRRLLNRGFLPLLLVGVCGLAAYELGLFGETTAAFATRGTVETGRLAVWPLAIGRFLSSPLAGVGASHFETYVPSMNQSFTPHNTFLAIALASGVVPLTLFLWHWVRAARRTLRGRSQKADDAPFRLPLLTYLFLVALQGTDAYMSQWGILALVMAVGNEAARPRRSLAVHRP